MLEPEVRRVGQVVLERRGRDALAEGRHLLGPGSRVEAQLIGDLPIGLRGGREFLFEEVAHPVREFVVDALEEQAGRAEAVAIGVEARNDDVKAPVGAVAVDAFPGASEAFQRIGRVREVMFLGGQAQLGAQLGRQERVGVAGSRDQVVGQAENDQVRDGVPRGFHPAREVHRLGGEALAEALFAGEGQGQSDPFRRGQVYAVLVGAERADGFLDGVGDRLGELQGQRLA